MSIDDSIKEICELEQTVRGHINTSRYKADLLKNSQTWNQICSSLDVIGDTRFAMESYMDIEFPGNLGMQYIHIFGVLQAIFVQQDAIQHLTEAFELEYKRPEVLRKIRFLRNVSIGHPTKQGKDNGLSHNYISRISLSKDGFDLLRHSDKKSYEMVRIDIPNIIEDQFREIASGYKTIVDKLAEANREHLEKYRNDPLADFLPTGMSYLLQKIGEGVASYDNAKLGLAHVEMVLENYQKFKDALEARNELSEYTEYDLKEYFHALARLGEFLRGESEFMKEEDARIFHTYIISEHEKFVQIANEIDEQYKAVP